LENSAVTTGLEKSVFIPVPKKCSNYRTIVLISHASKIPGLGRSPGEGKGYPLQYSGLENSKDCIVCGVAKSQTQLTLRVI